MTALAGFWSFDGRETAPAVRRMLKSQEMYGQQSADWSGAEISLGRRLFRKLPEDIHDVRPQVGGDGTLVLVADVRLDNREELAAALGMTAAAWRSTPDSAVLLRALEAWGDEAVARLVGDFAFALWDVRRQRLLLARDYIGQRPLHYHQARDFFAFASMPKGLHALPEVPIAPDGDAVADFMALLPETSPTSFFEGIERVLPGHLLIVTRDGARAERYWDGNVGRLRLKDDREYEEALRVEVDRAVACRLRGVNGAVGAHLSAGLDSSTVAATAARQLAGRGSVIAYTAAPREGYAGGIGGRITDEWPLSSAVAALYDNMEHVRIPSSGGSPVERLDRYFHAFDRPMLNLCNAVWLTAILDDARSRGLGVMLSAAAGNQTFSFDGMSALPQMLREGRWANVARTAVSLVSGGTRVGTVGAQVIGPFLPKWLWVAISRWRGKMLELTDYTLIRPDLAQSLTQRAAARGRDLAHRPQTDPHALRVSSLQADDPGNYNKGYLGAWGIDVRDPPADKRLAEFCLSIPAEQFHAGGVPRSLARRSFADRLPASVHGERRKGYQAADWHEAMAQSRAELSQELDRCFDVPQVGALISKDKAAQLIDAWPTGDWNGYRILMPYRYALLRATSAAHFIRKASRSNA